MLINTNQVISITEANQNFSRVAKIADREGSAVIFKNNKPRYMLVNLANEPALALSSDEMIDIVAARVLEKRRKAFEALAQ